MKLVLIEWIDSHAGRGWQDMDEIREACQPLYCRSVGWLISESNGCKTVVPHLSGDEQGKLMSQGRGEITIPEQAIVKLRVLRR